MNICNDSILEQNYSAVEQKSMRSIESVSFENLTVNFKQRTPLASISPNRETERSINLHHDHNYCNLGNPVISNLPKYVQLAIKKVCGPKEATRGSVQTTSSTFNVCDTFSSCRQSLSRNQSLQSLHPLPENHKHFKVSIELDGRKWNFFMSGYGAQIAEALARAQEGSSEELGKAIIESYILKQLPKQKPPHKELDKTSTPEKQSVNKENADIYTLDEASLPNEQVHEEITEADPLDEAFLPNEQSLHENTTETDPLDEACLSNEKLQHDATINTHALDKEFLSNEPLLHDDATEIHPLNEAPLSNEQLLHDKTMEFTNKETTQTHLLHETYISNDPLQNEATETCPSGETCLPNEESLDEDTTEKYSLVKQFLNFKTVEKSTKTEDQPLQKMSWKIASVILPSKKTFDSGSGIENSETIVRQQPSSTFQTLLGNKTSSKRPIVNMTAKSSATNRSNSAATRPNDDFQRRPIIYPRKCGVCEHTYVSRQTFSKHKKSCIPALEMSNLICPSCGKKFGFRSRFKFHVNHCGFGSCRNCRKCFKSHIRFDNHKKMFEKMKKCKDCNGLYVNECSFSRHQVLCKKYRRVLEYPETLHFDSILKFEEWMNDENGKLSRKDRYFVKVSGTQLTSNNKKFYRFRCKFEKERKRQCKNGIPTRVRILTPNYQCRARIHVTEYSDGRVVAKYNPNHSHPCGDIQIYSRSIYPRVCSLCLNTYKSKHLFYHHKKTCLPFLEMKKKLTGSAVSHLEPEVVHPMTDHSILGI